MLIIGLKKVFNIRVTEIENKILHDSDFVKIANFQPDEMIEIALNVISFFSRLQFSWCKKYS